MKESTVQEIILIIQNLGSYEAEVQANHLKSILEEKYNGNWMVIVGMNLVSVIPYIDNCYLCATLKGLKYVVAKVSESPD